MAKADTCMYRSLDIGVNSRQIRLIKLHRAESFTDDIHCTIFHTSLEDEPTYEALSYVWGSDDNPSTIFLHYDHYGLTNVAAGPEATQKSEIKSESGLRRNVTQNLEAALRHIRLHESDRVIWVDAICINQEDKPEKSHQVRQMRQIYLATKQVILWLGEEKDAGIALEFLKPMPLRANMQTDYRFKPEDIPKWIACDDLFGKRPYWSRSWILQEILHNRDVTAYIGMYQISIEDLLVEFKKYYFTGFALVSLGTTMPLDQPPSSWTTQQRKELSYDTWFRMSYNAHAVQDVIAVMRPKFKDPSFQTPRLSLMLMNFRDQKATEPKDKIYSLLGMVQQEYNIPIEYDNEKETVRDIFTITARQLLSRILLVLLWVESRQREIVPGLDGAHLPSWVPDFTQIQPLSPRFMHSWYTQFSADKDFPGGLKEVHISTPNNYGIFSIRGVYVACITGTHIAKLTKKWSDDPAISDFDLVKLIRYNQDPSLRDSILPPDDAWPTEPGMSAVTFDNTSWGPCKSEIGDIIVAAAGSKIPLVLRKHGDKYLFVGYCWLIDSQVKDLTKAAGEKDEAISPVMYGSIIKEIGKTREVEEFDLC